MRLAGVRVLVARPRERARELCFLLEDEGAEVVALPVLEIGPPDDPRPLRAAAEQIHRYGWIAFASPSAVDALAEAVREAGTLDRLERAKVAAVGPKTALAARERGLKVTWESGGRTGADLARELAAQVTGEDVLLPAAQEGRTELLQGLVDAGVSATRVVAYRAERAEVPPADVEALKEHPPRVVLIGSPRTAESLLEVLGQAVLEACRRVAIGPTTAAALAALGLPASAVAAEPTPDGLLEATVRAVRG